MAALGKRGRQANSVGAGSTGASVASSHHDGAAGGGQVTPSLLLGPTLHVQASFADQNHRRIVLGLQSGLKSELAWALNALTLLSFKEKDDLRRESIPLTKINGLLDALLHVIDEWRDVAYPRDSRKVTRSRNLGVNRLYTGFGLEYEMVNSNDPLYRLRSSADNKVTDDAKAASEWWWDEEGLFNLDEVGRTERQQCAVAASNVIRNFSFMPENEAIMAQHRHCLETLVRCIQDHDTEDEELVTNSLETILNVATFLNLRVFSVADGDPQTRITEKQTLEALMQMLESPVKAWHCSAAELFARLVVNPDNEPFLLPFAPQVYRRLVDMLSFQGADSQAAAVAALYNFAEINMDCRLHLANERWAVGRLLRIVQTPHPMPDVVRKAALTLESLASEPENRAILLAYEHTFAEIALTDLRMSDTFARILWELSSRNNSKSSARGVWGS